MDQRLIAIIVTVGFRFVLLVVPTLDRTMRRFWDWCNSGGGAGASSMEEGEEGERQIVQLHEIPMERGSPRRELQVMKLTGANARLELHLPEDEDGSMIN